MKTIKIRFVERENDFLIQRKTWFGWKYISYTEDMGYGAITYCYCKNAKDDLLNYVLEDYFKVGRKFVRIVEYPSLKLY